MLLVFLGLYVVLAGGSLVMGVRSRSRRALVCGLVALGFAAASALVSAVYAAGVTHWAVSVLDLLLSPLPESVLEPQSVTETVAGLGVPVIVMSTVELVVAIALWAVPVTGIVAASRTGSRA